MSKDIKKDPQKSKVTKIMQGVIVFIFLLVFSFVALSFVSSKTVKPHEEIIIQTKIDPFRD